MAKKLIGVPAGQVEETKAMVRLFLFLRCDCGLKEADNLTSKDLQSLLKCLSKKANCDRI